jgi:hypothetical protein
VKNPSQHQYERLDRNTPSHRIYSFGKTGNEFRHKLQDKSSELLYQWLSNKRLSSFVFPRFLKLLKIEKEENVQR